MLGFQQNRHLEIGAQFERGTGGIEPPTFCLQAWVPTNCATFGWPAHPYKSVCYIATPARPPKFGFWILEFGFWILDFGFWILDFGFWILDFGFWILDFGFWILDFGFWILDLGFWILDFGFWILDFGSWISDFGFWILDCRSIRSLCGSPKRGRLDFGFWILDFGSWILDFGFWILDFGFWILDFGFWILDFGFWILDLGFWILDFGFRILDFGFRQRFGFCIRLLLLHADSGRRIAAHIISHRIWNPEGEWCSTSGAGTGWNQSWGNFQVSWAEIVVFVQCKSRWRTKSWESYYWLIGKFLYLRWFLTLANSFFIGKRVDFFRNDSLRKLEGLSLSFFNLFSTIRIPISDGQHHNGVWSDCNMTTIWFRPMLLYRVEKKPPGRFDAGKRTACAVVCVTGIVEPKEWSNSMAKNGPQNVCCARAQLGQNNWQERGRMYISTFKMSCDRNFVVATDVVCCLLFVCCPLLVASCLLVASFRFFVFCCCCCWPVTSVFHSI